VPNVRSMRHERAFRTASRAQKPRAERPALWHRRAPLR
jgi:hypothetical protein